MPDKHEVGGSSPLGPTSRNILHKKGEDTTYPNKWGCSSAGRAPALQAGGHGFESHHLHHEILNVSNGELECADLRIRTEEGVNNSPVDC